jgi:pimeloyl-ACP methyl ester carboxylesterase
MTKKVNPWGLRLIGGVWRGLNSALRTTFLLGAGWIALSNLYINHKVKLGPAIPAERLEFDSQAAGRLSYYADLKGKGRPLVLVHSVNAAASSYEMHPLFDALRGTRPVFALDLPGFGFSERASRVYSPALYASAIAEFVETQVKKAADVMALSLGCEFAAQAALDCPKFFHSLVFISPSGFSRRAGTTSARVRRQGMSQRMHALLSPPLWGRPLFDFIATRPSIRFFLGRSFTGAVPQDLIDYDYATAHQPGAEIAPLYFVSGCLFNPDALANIYEKVDFPALVIYDRDGFTSFELLQGLMERKPNWRAERITPTLGLPQFEKLEETLKALGEFWDANK